MIITFYREHDAGEHFSLQVCIKCALVSNNALHLSVSMTAAVS